MLSKIESTSVFAYIRLCSFLHVIPYKLNSDTGTLELLSLKRRLIWALVYIMSTLHAVHTITEVFAQVILRRESMILHHFTIQLDWSFCPAFVITATLILHNNRSDVVLSVFNELYKQGTYYFSQPDFARYN